MQSWADVDEGPHAPDPVGDWSERWTFDFVTPDVAAAGTLRFELVPSRRRCVVWGMFVHDDVGYVLVRDDEVDYPSGQLEVRGSLWASAWCEEPMARWTLGLESFGVQFGPDEVTDAWDREYGGVAALGFDLSFDDRTPGGPGGADLAVDTGYVREGWVHGEVLLGRGGGVTTLELAGPGLRRHQWGVPRATAFSWATGRDEQAGTTVWHEHTEVLPRELRGLVRTDGRLTPCHHAPVVNPEPHPALVSRAAGRSPMGEVGWMECWYPVPRR